MPLLTAIKLVQLGLYGSVLACLLDSSRLFSPLLSKCVGADIALLTNSMGSQWIFLSHLWLFVFPQEAIMAYTPFISSGGTCSADCNFKGHANETGSNSFDVFYSSRPGYEELADQSSLHLDIGRWSLNTVLRPANDSVFLPEFRVLDFALTQNFWIDYPIDPVALEVSFKMCTLFALVDGCTRCVPDGADVAEYAHRGSDAFWGHHHSEYIIDEVRTSVARDDSEVPCMIGNYWHRILCRSPILCHKIW